MRSKKGQFSAAERYGVWQAHMNRCSWCSEPVMFKYVEVDHVIPESLLSTPDKYQEVMRDFGLDAEFDINSWENWLPLCRPCNGKKEIKFSIQSPQSSNYLRLPERKQRKRSE